MRFGIIICTRLASSRVPGKALALIHGKPLLEHLIHRLLPLRCPIILACPHRDIFKYQEFAKIYDKKSVQVIAGSEFDPMERMRTIAVDKSFDAVIRICHDKIFVDQWQLASAMRVFQEDRPEYLYAKDFMEGTGFEIISLPALSKAADRFRNVEHVSYAIRAIADKIVYVSNSEVRTLKHRLLIDYPEDLSVAEVILQTLGNDCSQKQALDFLDEHPNISRINTLPTITFYTCAYNAAKWIEQCMGTVSSQRLFHRSEYILIDDCSQDRTLLKLHNFAAIYARNTVIIRNQKNLGLASSSNIALTHARGQYIMRIDADDYLIGNQLIQRMIEQMEATSVDILYPDHFFGAYDLVQTGSLQHHVGGALFRTRAANHVKFTEGLRGYEGLDFFCRARKQLKVGYFKEPTFFYRQHSGSLSQSDPLARAKIKEEIEQCEDTKVLTS